MKKGFTLIELLVVIAIIALLSTLSVVALNSARVKARDARRVSDIKQIRTALEMYFDAKLEYPAGSSVELGSSTARCLSATNAFNANCAGTIFMQNVPKDPQSPTRKYKYVKGTGTTPTYTIEYFNESDNVTKIATESSMGQ